MPKANAPITSFNHGMVSPLALARVDLTRLRFAAETQQNYMPRTVGPMTMRPGWKFLARTKNDAKMLPVPFVFSSTDHAFLEFASGAVRVRLTSDDDSLVTREEVATTITSGDFSASTGWTLTGSGSASATVADGLLKLSSVPLGGLASAEQLVLVSVDDLNVEHALRISIPENKGPVNFRVGSTSGDDDYVTATNLGPGEHSLAFTPAGPFYVRFETRLRREVQVASCTIEAAGTMELTNPYNEADLPFLRWAQSGDIIYLACVGYDQRKIERRDTNSWSLVYYQPEDGPFKVAATDTVSITPSDTKGAISLTADKGWFKTSQVGSLLRMTTSNQSQTSSISAADTFTDAIRVTGVHETDDNPRDTIVGTGSRTFTLTISGTYSGTLTLQRSFDGEDFGFDDIDTFTSADNGTDSITDEFDNSIVWYRIGFKTGDYTSGTAVVTLDYPGGGFAGVVRITAVSGNNVTTAVADVLSPLSAAVATKDWQEGEWSDKYGWPSAVTLFEGRLWWFGKDRIWGSVSDAYESFDVTLDGDSASIQRSIGYGPVETIAWALPLHRLLIGTGASEISIRSSSFDEPLSPTNFALKDASTQGCAQIAAVKVDRRGLFVTRSKRRLYQLAFSVEAGDYTANDLTALLPDIGLDFVKLAVQRHPDTRIHCVMSDGTMLVLLFEPSEEVICWYKVVHGGNGVVGDAAGDYGVIEDVVVMPGSVEDRVYYVVRTTVSGATQRFVEKQSLLSENTGFPGARLVDAYVEQHSATATGVVPGLDHLEGKAVVTWAWDDDDDDGVATGTLTVSGGQVTLAADQEYQNIVVGMPYVALFKSAKLAYAAAAGTALNQKKRIDHLGLILRNTHADGVRYGQELTHLSPLSLMYRGQAISGNAMYEEFDEDSQVLNGKWDTDARLWLRTNSPAPCTILGAVISLKTNDKI